MGLEDATNLKALKIVCVDKVFFLVSTYAMVILNVKRQIWNKTTKKISALLERNSQSHINKRVV